jgi:sigma-B regulation protein RsbU (phosphoserine phosphatase)
MEILVADDLLETRLLLKSILKRLGHEVITTEDGALAWEALIKSNISLVITDWEMPNLSGIELCKKIRETDLNRYVYIILLTAKNEKQELVEGMEAGADDFISKPFNNQELNVRIRAGERIIRLQNDLEEKNYKLKTYNDRLEKDLNAAADLQKSLLPQPFQKIQDLSFESIFMPSLFVAGDIFNYFELDEENTGFYLLDVSGHGVSSAMLSFTLSKFLSVEHGDSRGLVKIYSEEDGGFINTPPDRVLTELNKLFEMGLEVMQYFTMVYGKYNRITREMEFSLGGHPPVIIVHKDKPPTVVDLSSIPIGMFDHSEYERAVVKLEPGDMVYVYSDGFCECFDIGDGKVTELMVEWLEKYKHLDKESLNETIKSKMRAYSDNNPEADDISLMMITVI